ncbi:VanZ family protein [Curtobacterium sp. A7_M15]|uniref:VanZ family protein n=1 Tax=Curtobacterium sp. A7_M15 TaxID=3065241 RepID=UPI0027379188|nr:VanZ family protein [Curtobacterium sp. A7_M15]MDP4333842.1 VanZ family protein [Curtobacterium sp. A7_M15]
MFGRVPMLPVVVPMAVVLFVLLLWVLHRRGRLTPARGAVEAAAALYAGGVAANTVFPIFLAWPRSDGADPLPLNLVPVVGYEVGDAVTNALVFVPLGILVSLMLARPTWARTIAVTAGISAAVEVTQFLTARFAHGGHIADVNDLASNVLGGALGAAVYALAMRRPALARVVERFRWHREVTA